MTETQWVHAQVIRIGNLKGPQPLLHRSKTLKQKDTQCLQTTWLHYMYLCGDFASFHSCFVFLCGHFASICGNLILFPTKNVYSHFKVRLVAHNALHGRTRTKNILNIWGMITFMIHKIETKIWKIKRSFESLNYGLKLKSWIWWFKIKILMLVMSHCFIRTRFTNSLEQF